MKRQHRKVIPNAACGTLQRRIGERWPLFFILLIFTFLISA